MCSRSTEMINSWQVWELSTVENLNNFHISFIHLHHSNVCIHYAVENMIKYGKRNVIINNLNLQNSYKITATQACCMYGEEVAVRNHRSDNKKFMEMPHTFFRKFYSAYIIFWFHFLYPNEFEMSSIEAS